MPKKLEKENGKWVDLNNKKAEFHGRVGRDLEIGDEYIVEENGKQKLKKVVSKTVDELGYTFVAHIESEV